MALEALKERRSIRNFDPSFEVTKEQLDTIIECSLNAPSALNLQENDLIVIKNKETIKKIDDVVYGSIPADFKERFAARQKRYGTINPVTYDCSALILVVKNERANDYCLLDSGILAMAIMTATQAVGLGSVPLGCICKPEVEQLLGLPKGSLCLGIAIGKSKGIDVDPKDTLRKVTYIE